MIDRPPSPPKTGVAWWRTLNIDQKISVVQPLIEQFEMSNKSISDFLKLDSIGRIAGVRDEINQRKKKASPIHIASSIPEPTMNAALVREAFLELEFEQQAALIEARLLGRWSPRGIYRPFNWLSKSLQQRISTVAAVVLIETGRQ